MAKAIRIYKWDDTDIGYDGDFDATVSPNGELLIVENIPDVGNKNDGHDTKEIRAIYNKDSWLYVEVE